MAVIHLTQGKSCVVDDDDHRLLSTRKWRLVKGGYAGRSSTRNGKPTPVEYMHRTIVGNPAGFEVDHIDGDRLNNRRSNLRVATHSQNGANRKRPTSSGRSSQYKGVRVRPGGKFEAHAKKDGKDVYLGMHNSEIGAAKAYNKFMSDNFGEFAVLNDIKE